MTHLKVKKTAILIVICHLFNVLSLKAPMKRCDKPFMFIETCFGPSKNQECTQTEIDLLSFTPYF